MTTPSYAAARTGLPGDPTVINAAAEVNQMLTAHGLNAVQASAIPNFQAAGLYPTSTEDVVTGWSPLSTTDYAVGIGGAAGEIDVDGLIIAAVRAVGRGADLQVSIAPDNGNNGPGAVISTTYIPRDVINALGSSDGTLSGLQVPQNHLLQPSITGRYPWGMPALGTGGRQEYPAQVSSGNFMVWVGGLDTSNNDAISSVFVIPWLGNGQIGNPLLRSSLPVALDAVAVTASGDTLIVAGGVMVTNGTSTGYSSSVYAASWSPLTGDVGAWSQQASLPQALYGAAAAYDEASGTVFVVGGAGSDGQPRNTVYRATVSSGQVGAWAATEQMPVAQAWTQVAVLGGYLVVVGGTTGSVVTGGNGIGGDVYYAKIKSDGTLEPWQTGPRSNGSDGPAYAPVGNGMVIIGTQDDPSVGVGDVMQTITWGPTGPGNWWYYENVDGHTWAGIPGVFDNGDGTWDLIFVEASEYYSMRLTWLPLLACFRPALTAGQTNWVLLHQVGGDDANYLELATQTVSGGGGYAVQTSPSGADNWIAKAGLAACVGWDSSAYTSQNKVNGIPSGALPAVMQASDTSRQTQLLVATTPDQRLLGLVQSTARTRRNLCSNPSFEANISGWSAGGTPAPTIAQSIDQAYVDSHSLKITSTGAASFLPDANFTVTGLTVGATYTVSAYCYVPAGSVKLGIYVFGGTVGSDTGGTTGQWVRVSVTFIATASSHTIGIQQFSTAAGQIGYVDAVLFEEGSTLGSYFDGPLYEDPDGMFLTSAAAVEFDASGVYPIGVTTIDPVAPA